MKTLRKEKILEIIETRPIETQEELILALRNSGYEVTQSTASRDIKQLGLIKVLDSNGRYRYARNIPHKSHNMQSADHDRLLESFKSSVIGVKFAMNDVVIKCYSGMAQAACVAFDALFSDRVVGSLAGEDTIFVITADEAAAAAITKELNNIMGV